MVSSRSTTSVCGATTFNEVTWLGIYLDSSSGSSSTAARSNGLPSFTLHDAGASAVDVKCLRARGQKGTRGTIALGMRRLREEN